MRKIGLFAFVLMLCCISGAAFAQDAAPTYCGTLSEEDCAIVTGAQELMQALDSVSIDITFNLGATNIPDMDEPINISLSGDASVTGIQALDALLEDTSAIESDPGTAIGDILRSFDLDMNLTLALPSALMAAMDADMPSDITLQLRLVDGFAYLNLDPLQPFIGRERLEGWYGLDVANLVKGLITDMPDMIGDMSSMMESQGMDSMAYMENFSDPEILAQFVTITRTDDGSGDMAIFETSVDLGALMSSPEFQDMMQQQMQSQMEMQGEAMSEEDMEMAMQMSEQMMQGMVISVTEEISLTDGYLHSIHGSFSLDTSSMMAAMGEAMGDTGDDSASTEEAPVINIDFAINYSEFDSVAEITAPEGATVIPYRLALRTIMGSLGD